MMHFIWEIIQETWVIILVFGIFIYFTAMFDQMNINKTDKEDKNENF